jgi:hypothetical protein
MAAITATAHLSHAGTIGAPPAHQGVTAPALGIQSFYQSKIQSYVSNRKEDKVEPILKHFPSVTGIAH